MVSMPGWEPGLTIEDCKMKIGYCGRTELSQRQRQHRPLFITGALALGWGLGVVQPAVAQLQFATPSVYSVSDYPSSIGIGDLNGDGQPDLAVANFNGSSVTVLLNRGDGTFWPGTNYSVDPYPWTVVLADVNGDHKLDLVTPGEMSGNVVVRLGLGDGTFAPALLSSALAPPFSEQLPYPEGLAVGDVNGDGNPDVVLANTAGVLGTNWATVILGDGTGHFHSPTNYVALGGSAVSLADLNGDGKLDMAIPDGEGSNVSVLLNLGDGSFGPATNFPTGGQTGYSLLTVDVNNDGIPDLVIANNDSQSVSVLLGHGDGSFGEPRVFPLGDYARGLAAGDFDADGHLDLAVSTWGGQLFVLRGDGLGNFSLQYTQAPGGVSFAAAAADLDGNGTVDLVRADYGGGTIEVLLNQTPPTLSFSAAGNPLVLTWRALPGFELEQAATLTQANWTAVTNGISYHNGNAVAMPALEGPVGFFRLRKAF